MLNDWNKNNTNCQNEISTYIPSNSSSLTAHVCLWEWFVKMCQKHSIMANLAKLSFILYLSLSCVLFSTCLSHAYAHILTSILHLAISHSIHHFFFHIHPHNWVFDQKKSQWVYVKCAKFHKYERISHFHALYDA